MVDTSIATGFPSESVLAVRDTCIAADVDYMEARLQHSPRLFPRGGFGPWRCCHEDDLNRVFGHHDPRQNRIEIRRHGSTRARATGGSNSSLATRASWTWSALLSTRISCRRPSR